MAYKYKLVKEIKPAELEKAADTVGPYVMKDIIAKRLNYADFDELEKDLGNIGIEQDQINQILDLWAERAQLMHMNEKEEGYAVEKVGKDKKTGKDILKIEPGSLQTALDNRLQKFKDENDPEFKFDPKAKNTFKDKEEQGKANLTKEVLRRLKNR